MQKIGKCFVFPDFFQRRNRPILPLPNYLTIEVKKKVFSAVSTEGAAFDSPAQRAGKTVGKTSK